MTQTEKISKLIYDGVEEGRSNDEWIVSLLASIASSLAIIADKMSEEGERDDEE